MANQINLKRAVTGGFLFVSSFIAFVTLASHILAWTSSLHQHEFRSVDALLSSLVSPRTARAVTADEIFRRNFLVAVEAAADLTKRVATQFEAVPELQQASENLESYRSTLKVITRAPRSRSIRRDLFGLGSGDATADSNSGGILSGITDGIGSALSGIGSSLLQDANGAGLFLGTGLGAGAAQGLNLAPAAMTMQIAAKVAADNGMNATGLNPAIQSAAMGAAASLLGAVNVSSLLGSATGGLDTRSLVLGLATGIGNGTSAGLNLSPQASAVQAPAGNSTGDIAGTFGFGLTKSLVSNINVSMLASQATAGTSFNISSITGGQPASQIALSLAQGIGNGASSGLKLSQANLVAPNGNSTADVAGAFTFGLTQTLTQNINTSNINLSGGASALSGLTKNVNFGLVAQGAAMGFVQGAGDAVNSMGGVQALINGTAVMPTGSLPGTSMNFNDSVGGAATGFGQGLGGQGTVVGVQLLSKLNVTSLIAGITSDGASSAGNSSNLGKRHTLHPAEIIRRQTAAGVSGTNTGFNLSAIINAASISSVGQSAFDALGCEGIGGLVLVVLGLSQSGTISIGGVSSVNTTLIKNALPKGVIRFTSGGNTFAIDGTIISDNIDRGLLRAANGVSINGHTVITFAAFLVIHILLALLAFMLLIPFVLSIEAVRNLLVRLRMSHILPKIPRWMDIIWLYVMSPLALFVLIFGSLTGGTSGHFRTGHGALGLITIIVTFASSVAHFYAKQTAPGTLKRGLPLPTTPFRIIDPITIRSAINQLLFALIVPTVMGGLADLSSVTVCITRVVPLEATFAFAVSLSFFYTVATALTGFSIWLSVRDIRKHKRVVTNKSCEEASLEISQKGQT